MNSCVVSREPTSICFRPTNTPMPWSTWTTRSPTFRSRKSGEERACGRAAALGRRGAPPRRRRSRRRPAAPRPAAGTRATARPSATRTAAACAISPRACVCVALPRDRRRRGRRSGRSRAGARRCARRGPGVAATNRTVSPASRAPLDVLGPVGDAPAELDGGLAVDGDRAGRACDSRPATRGGATVPRSSSESVARSSSIASSSRCVPSSKSAVTSSSETKSFSGAGTSAPRASRVSVAAGQLLERLLGAAFTSSGSHTKITGRVMKSRSEAERSPEKTG